MARALLLCGSGPEITPEHLLLESPPTATLTTGLKADEAPRRHQDDEERQRVLDALAACAGNQTHAAKLLGISRTAFVMRLVQYGLPRPRGRSKRRRLVSM
jgi:DNA-binding NtrC family response regulator